MRWHPWADVKQAWQEWTERIQLGEAWHLPVLGEVLVRPAAVPPTQLESMLTRFDSNLPRIMTTELFPDAARAQTVAERLRTRGFFVASQSRTSMTIVGALSTFRNAFGGSFGVRMHAVDALLGYEVLTLEATELQIPNDLRELVSRITIATPPTLFEAATPPSVTWTHLAPPSDIAKAIGADRVHRRGITGKGINVWVLDSGCYGHAYFNGQGLSVQSAAATGIGNATHDAWGHGTAMAAVVLAVAPGATVTVAKVKPDGIVDFGSYMVDAFRQAVKAGADVISMSLGWNETDASRPLTLASDIAAAPASCVLVAAVGNQQQHAYPANLDPVIAVGGAWDDGQNLRASDFTSSFKSTHTSKQCPDLCGISGAAPKAVHCLLPTSPGSIYDNDCSNRTGNVYPDSDDTLADDGWIGCSGSSAAAAMVAGVAALVREAKSRLSAADVKQVLESTADDVQHGRSADGDRAVTGRDDATGWGLVNADAAVTKAAALP